MIFTHCDDACRDALGAAFNMQGGFNDLVMTLSHGANEKEIITRLDHMLERYGGLLLVPG